MHNRELLDNLGEKFTAEDLLLISTLLNQQQDPNALTNLVNILLISKLMGSRSGLEGALLVSMLLNTSQQTAGAGIQQTFQSNMLPLLLLMGIGREREEEGYRGGGWRDKDRERDKDTDAPRAN